MAIGFKSSSLCFKAKNSHPLFQIVSHFQSRYFKRICELINYDGQENKSNQSHPVQKLNRECSLGTRERDIHWTYGHRLKFSIFSPCNSLGRQLIRKTYCRRNLLFSDHMMPISGSSSLLKTNNLTIGKFSSFHPSDKSPYQGDKCGLNTPRDS